MDGDAQRIVFRAKDNGRVVAVAAGVPLLALSVFIVVFANPLGGVLVLAALWALSALWQRAVLTDRELVVQGRLTRRRVDLADLEAAHQDKTRRCWVAARGQRPFRVLFVPLGEGTRRCPGAFVFVPEVRRRAAALGAPVDVDGPVVMVPPRTTSKVFSL